MRYADVIGAVSSDLKQSYQDQIIEPYTILYWVNIVANQLLYQHIQNDWSKNSWVNGEYIRPFRIRVRNEGNAKYFELPLGVLNINGRDDGINFVTYDLNQDFGDYPDLGMRQFTRTAPAVVPRLYMTWAEKPSPSNPYYYRIADKAYLIGIENVPCEYVKTGLVLGTTMQDIKSIEEEIRIPQHLLKILHYEVLKLGQFALMVPEDEDKEKLKQLSKVNLQSNEEQ
jgi:hypothetical protein